MPDYSFIAQPQTSSGLQSLSSIMNTANAAQNLQMNNLNIQQKQQTLQADIERAKAESATAQAGAQVSGQTVGPKVTQEQQAAKQAEIKTNLAQYGLTGAYAAGARTATNALIQDPAVIAGDGPEIIKAIAKQRQVMIDSGVPADKAEANAAHLIALASAQPKAVRQFLANQIQTNLSPEGQAAQNLVPASTQQVPTQGLGPRGLPGVVSSNQFGEKQIGGMPVNGGQPGGPIVYPPNESAATQPEVEGIRANAQKLAAAAPNQHFNNKMILDLTPDAFTGTGSGKLANVMNAVGLNAFVPKSAADIGPATAQLRHFIALQVEQNAASQGANTDAARSLAATAVLPSDSPEKAIKAITKINDAYVTGHELYNTGMQAAVSNPQNQKGIFAARDFQNAWAQNFDPRIMLLENAAKSGDKAEISRLKSQLGPTGVKSLLQKAQTLRSLSQGQM